MIDQAKILDCQGVLKHVTGLASPALRSLRLEGADQLNRSFAAKH